MLRRWLIAVLLVALPAQAADRYWVGNGGTWDTTHWSTTSGGSSGASVPNGDNCFFDSNSFSTTGQTVDAASASPVHCASMDWTGALHNPTFSFTIVTLTGSLTLISGMTVNPTGLVTPTSPEGAFSLNGSGTVITGGQPVGWYVDASGAYHLGDHWHSVGVPKEPYNAVNLVSGTFAFDGEPAEFDNIMSIGTPTGGNPPATIDFTSSGAPTHVILGDNDRSMATHIPGTSLIEFHPLDFSEIDSTSFIGNDVELNAVGNANSFGCDVNVDTQIDQNATINGTLTFDPGVVVASRGDNTLTVGALACTGTSDHHITIGAQAYYVSDPQCRESGQLTLSVTAGVTCDYVDLHNVTCVSTGGVNPCYMGTHSTATGTISGVCLGDPGDCPTYTPTTVPTPTKTPTPVPPACCPIENGPNFGGVVTCLDFAGTGGSVFTSQADCQAMLDGAMQCHGGGNDGSGCATNDDCPGGTCVDGTATAFYASNCTGDGLHGDCLPPPTATIGGEDGIPTDTPTNTPTSTPTSTPTMTPNTGILCTNGVCGGAGLPISVTTPGVRRVLRGGVAHRVGVLVLSTVNSRCAWVNNPPNFTPSSTAGFLIAAYKPFVYSTITEGLAVPNPIDSELDCYIGTGGSVYTLEEFRR